MLGNLIFVCRKREFGGNTILAIIFGWIYFSYDWLDLLIKDGNCSFDFAYSTTFANRYDNLGLLLLGFKIYVARWDRSNASGSFFMVVSIYR